MIHWHAPAGAPPTWCAAGADPTETISGQAADVSCPRCRDAIAAWNRALRRALETTRRTPAPGLAVDPS